MENVAEEEIKKGNKILRIFRDDFLTDFNPRENDNFGTFILSHKKYNFSNELNLNFDDFGSWEEVKKNLQEEHKAKIILSVFMYEHGDISISLNDNYPFNDKWDSGFLGFICCLEEDILNEFGKVNKTTIKKAEEILKGEFEIYKNYIEGEVFGFKLFELKKFKIKKTDLKTKKTEEYTTTEEEEIESCWGYYGEEGLKQIKEENNF